MNILMTKFYTLSSFGLPENQVLFPTIRPVFEAAGHVFVDDVAAADVVLIDLHSRIEDYSHDAVDKIVRLQKPCVFFDEWDRGSMSKDEWPFPLRTQQRNLLLNIFLKQIKQVHFCRLLDKTKVYPSYLYPFEKPISFEEPICTPEDLFNREYDVVYIANGAPNRERIAEALRQDGRLKCLIKLGEPKLPFDEFLALHKRGKFFISSAAGGYTDERVQCLFSIAAIIRQRTDQWVANDFSHLENCLRIDSPPTEQDLNDLYEICNNKEKLYQIYLDGVTFVKQYWSAEAMGKRYLEILTKEGIL